MDSNPPIHNERSPDQWEIIKGVNFSGTVVDLGCGYADILFRLSRLGKSAWLIGVDDNPSIVFRNQGVNEEHTLGVEFWNVTVEDFVSGWNYGTIDTAICFSVLPYLDSPDYLLAFLRHNTKQTLIECQYAGDGPGFRDIKDDYDMGVWLGQFWKRYRPLGYTTIDYRDVDRTIWLCEQ